MSKVIAAIGAVLKGVPAPIWTALAGVLSTILVGVWQRHEGSVAMHDHVKDSVWTVAKVSEARAVKAALASIPKADSAAKIVTKTVTVQLGISADSGNKLRNSLEAAQSALASVFAVLGHQSNATTALNKFVASCQALAHHDSIAEIAAKVAVAAVTSSCAQEIAVRDTTIARLRKLDSLDAHKPAPVMATPRLVFGVGGGYDLSWVTAQTFTGRPFATLDATVGLPLGFQLVGAVSAEPHVQRPTDFAIYAHHDLARIF